MRTTSAHRPAPGKPSFSSRERCDTLVADAGTSPA